MCIWIPEEKGQEDWHWVHQKALEQQEAALLDYQMKVVGPQLQVPESQVEGLADAPGYP
jgi:hypothetical protein